MGQGSGGVAHRRDDAGIKVGGVADDRAGVERYVADRRDKRIALREQQRSRRVEDQLRADAIMRVRDCRAWPAGRVLDRTEQLNAGDIRRNLEERCADLRRRDRLTQLGSGDDERFL